jgi:NADH dehydrogenase FAD-containing subunit
LDQGKQQLQQIRQQIKQARHVLIIGGGPVGIELAGELKDANLKDQQVTLIHSQSQLGHPSYMPLKVHHKLLHLMTSNGIRVLLDDKVDLPPSSSGTMVVVPSAPLAASHKGVDLSGIDLIVMATGNRPSPQWIQSSVPDLLQSDNYVKVKPTLQVDHPDFPNLFVLGDIAGLDEAKLAYRAANGHTPIVAANINTLLTNGTRLKEYKKGVDIMLITFGKVRQEKGSLKVTHLFVLVQWGHNLAMGDRARRMDVKSDQEQNIVLRSVLEGTESTCAKVSYIVRRSSLTPALSF